jgi:hypothetical protein
VKPETIEWLKGAGWMALAFILTFAFWAFTTSARADDDVLNARCEAKGVEMICTLPLKDLAGIIESNNQGWAAAELEARRAKEFEAKLKQPPKCAVLDVEPTRPTQKPEPSKAPPLRKERDL